MASTSDRSPIWAHPEPGSRRPRFTREQIAATALTIADIEGFEAVSMRRIATELGAGTMTLYHYVRTKDDLIALMDNAVMAEVLFADDELPIEWRAGLTAIARRTREVQLRHAWAQHALQNAAAGPSAIRHVEQSLSVLSRTSLDTLQKFAVIGMVDDYVSGNVLRANEIRNEPGGAAANEPIMRFVNAQLESGRYPHTEAAFTGADSREMWSKIAESAAGGEQFEIGLAALLNGAADYYGLSD
ncbi:MAG TPA: TetR/AcrR family transcriptional regulator [Pseudonocardiaceae bacterium]|jgi:AcrR family transcriptional regulator|nr:TetR/AcrR family transcriptional regulator [Pseudonocardiaceae bacterium]